jgi:hypothetical protein
MLALQVTLWMLRIPLSPLSSGMNGDAAPASKVELMLFAILPMVPVEAIPNVLVLLAVPWLLV